MQKKMKKRRKLIIQITVSILVSALFIFLTFKDISAGQWQTIKSGVLSVFSERSGMLLLLLGVLTLLAALFVRAPRWRLLIKGDVRLSTLVSATYIGYMMNNIFPAKLGEAARAYIVGSREGVSRAGVFSSVVLERLIDGYVMVGIIFFAAFFNPQVLSSEGEVSGGLGIKGFSLQGTALSLFLLFTVLMLLLFLLKAKRSAVLSVVDKAMNFLPRKAHAGLIRVLHNFSVSIGGSVKWKDLPLLVFLSVLYWLTVITGLLFIYYAFPETARPELSSPHLALALTAVFTGLGLAVPAGPGNMGTFEFMGTLSLMLFSATKEGALTYLLVFHYIGLAFPRIITGAIFALAGGVKITQEMDNALEKE